MEWKRDHLESEQLILARPALVTVETEAALPGGLREEAKVYYADAQVLLNGGEMAGSRITVDGKVNFRVLYAQGDLSKIEVLEAAAPLNQALMLKEEGEQGVVRVQPRAEVQHLSAKASHGRLLLKASLRLTAQAALPRSLSFVRDGEGDPLLQKDMQALSVQRVTGEGESQNLLREEFALSPALQIQHTLCASAYARAEDLTAGEDGKVIVTGIIELEACHASAMPGRPLVCTRHTLPFEQAVYLSGALGDALAARSMIRDAAVLTQETENGPVMRAEVQLCTGLTAVADEEISALRDAFSAGDEEISFRRQPVTFRAATVQEQTAESGKTLLMLPEGSPRVKTPLLAFARPVLTEARRQGGRLSADGLLQCTLIYLTDDSEIPVSVQQEEPFHCDFASEAGPEDALTLFVSQIDASALTGDRVELQYILHLMAEGVRTKEASLIADAETEKGKPAEKGLSLYFLQPGEGLWDAAKACRTAPDVLRRLNPQLPDAPAAGTAVLVYKP